MKVSIRWRFFAGVALSAALAVAILAGNLYYARVLSDRTNRLVLTSGIRSRLQGAVAESLQYIRDGGPGRLASIFETLDEFDVVVDELEESINSGELGHSMPDLMESVSRLRRSFNLLQMTIRGDLETWARLDAHQVSAPYRRLLVTRMMDVDAEMGKISGTIATEAGESLRQLHTAQILAVSTILLIGLASLHGVNTYVLRPIPLMAKALAAVAKGNLRARVRLEDDSEFTQIAESFNDMTRDLAEARETIGKYHMEIQEKNEALERASTMKSEFLANMSHELRTPLNAINGYTHLLRQGLYGNLSREQEEALSGIAESSAGLLELINDILDISKVEAGVLKIHMDSFDAVDLARESIDVMRPMADEKGLDLALSVPDGEISIRSDRLRVRQIVLNLLSNAVKFTPKGGVGLAVREKDDLLEIEVRDTGIGINKDDQKRVFEMFQQLDGTARREQGGTGLGLSISKKLAGLLGGDIRLSSKQGEGSVFTLELPLKEEEEIPVSETQPPVEQELSSGSK